MDKDNAKILNALVWAMQAETDGHYFYKMAAGKTKDYSVPQKLDSQLRWN